MHRENTEPEWHIYLHEDRSGDWVVQGINVDGEGQIYTTIFTDADAEARARKYYESRASAESASPSDEELGPTPLARELRRRCNTKMSLLHQSAWYEACNELEKIERAGGLS